MFDVYVKNADGTIDTIRGPLDVQIDLYKKAADGKRIASEVKSGSGTAISATAKLRDQMEKQAAAVAQYHDTGTPKLANELHWYFEKPPTQGVKDHARAMAQKYGVEVRLMDPAGNEYLAYV